MIHLGSERGEGGLQTGSMICCVRADGAHKVYTKHRDESDAWFRSAALNNSSEITRKGLADRLMSCTGKWESNFKKQQIANKNAKQHHVHRWLMVYIGQRNRGMFFLCNGKTVCETWTQDPQAIMFNSCAHATRAHKSCRTPPLVLWLCCAHNIIIVTIKWSVALQWVVDKCVVVGSQEDVK